MHNIRTCLWKALTENQRSHDYRRIDSQHCYFPWFFVQRNSKKMFQKFAIQSFAELSKCLLSKMTSASAYAAVEYATRDIGLYRRDLQFPDISLVILFGSSIRFWSEQSGREGREKESKLNEKSSCHLTMKKVEQKKKNMKWQLWAGSGDSLHLLGGQREAFLLKARSRIAFR